MIKKNQTEFEGLFILESPFFVDERGSFKKIFNSADFHGLHLECDFKEFYYSINKKNTIRGMHFQTPPHDHVKIVYCVAGSITDVCIDLRKKSRTYGDIFSINLIDADLKYLYIPKGIAHGFIAHEDRTIVHYAQTTCYAKDFDHGLLYDSIGYDWKVKDPILSERDLRHPAFEEYVSPF